ncbi:M24 family metallopeptidase [candidate division GN15 bacterium]|nr:M24 family metallopeptidase [candidate division GN15 bacterium]
MQTNDIPRIQEYLKQHKLDGWLLVDFHGRNDVFTGLLGITGMLTRRACYFIPASGTPTALVNPIEATKFSGVVGEVMRYKGYKGLEAELKKTLAGCKRVAMEYSPSGRLPYIGLVDAGTIELVRSWGIEVVTSADLVAHFQARLTEEQMQLHREAAKNVIEIKDAAFGLIAKSLRERGRVTEYDVVQFIREQFDARGMETDHGPNCSVNAHAGDPHYEPSEGQSEVITPGSLILIDLWAKAKRSDGVYADITWMAYAGTRDEVPARYIDLFSVVTKARDAAIEFLRENLGKRTVQGWEVDDVCRAVIEQAGHGPHFVHRTGHSIGSDVHGPGPNLDNLETEDNRALQVGHLFSIEPGVYFEDCGFRSEIDGMVTEKGLEIATTPLQTEILPLLEN